MKRLHRRSHHACTERSEQRGIVLFVALIALVLLGVASIALVRTFGAGASISGNIAFKQAATQAGDIGVELAFNALKTSILPAKAETNIPFQYYALMQPSDAAGVPRPKVGGVARPIDWKTYPCYGANADPAQPPIQCDDESSYRIQYVIDRQCVSPSDTLPVADIDKQCIIGPGEDIGSHRAGNVVFAPPATVFYRVTVNIRGPRNTTSLVQASLAF
ncbi:MAG: hypothetical protein V4695_00225 [Pseudomonadota bacterium]